MKKISKIFVALLFCFCVMASSATVSTAALNKVTGLKVSAVTVSKVKLTWTAVSGAKQYQIRVYQGDKVTKTISTSSSAASYTVTGLTPGKTYKFAVRAYKNAINYGSYSSKVSAKTGVDDIKNLKATTSVTSVKLSWSKVSGASGYIVQQKVSGKWKTIKKTTSNSYNVSGLKPDTKYSFRVRAYTKYNGKTYYSEYASKSATPCVAAPKVTVSSSYKAATVKWSKVSGAAGYQVSLYNGSKWSSAKKIAKDKTSYKYSDLLTGTTYKARVRAYQKATVSGKTKTYYSAWTTVSFKPSLTAVSGTKISAYADKTATVNWSKVSGASGYQVVYATSSDFKTNSKTATVKGGSTVSKALSSLATGTKYYVKVRAYRTVNGKNVYSSYSSVVSFTTKPAQVTGLKASAISESSIKVTWTKTTCSGYQIRYKKAGADSWTYAKTTSNSYTLSSLGRDTSYSFQLRAYNSAGTYGSYSSALTAVTYGLKATSTTTLSWNSVLGAASYTVQKYVPSTDSWAKVKSGITSTSYKVSDSSLIYRVIAYKSDGKTVLYTSNVTTMNNTEVTIGSYSVGLSWAAVSKATEYGLYVYDLNGKRTTVSNGTSRSMTYNLAPATVHKIEIYAKVGSSYKVIDAVTVKTDAINVSDTSAAAKNAQILYLVQAINNTKYDEDFTVKATSGGSLDYEISYLELGFDCGNEITNQIIMRLISGFIEADTAVEGNAIVCKNSDAVQELMDSFLSEGEESEPISSHEELEELTYTFTGGTAKINTYSEYYLDDFLEPLSESATWSGAQSASKWSSAFNSVTTTYNSSDKTHTITAVLKKETTPNYHTNFIAKETISGSADINGLMGDNSVITTDSVGATTLTAVIDENCHLVSYNISVPSKTTLSASETEKVTLSDDADGLTVDLTISFKITLDSRSNYTYKFVEQ